MSGWPMVKLGEICTINPRRDKSVDYRTEISFIEMKSLLENGSVYPTITHAEKYLKGYTPFKHRDILVAKITPCFQNGKIGIANLATEFGFGTTEFHILRTKEDLLPEYLTAFLRQRHVLLAGEKQMTGSGGQRRVPKAFLEQLNIPLPSLGEQKRIAEILQKSAESIKQIIYEIEGLEKLSLSVADHFIRAEVPDKQPLNELVDFHGGSTPSKKNKDFWTDNGICWFTSKDLKFDELADSLDHITKKATSETALKPVSEKKSIAISLRGMSLAHRVPMSIIPGNSCVNQDLKALIPKEDMDIYVLFTLLKREEKFLLTKVSSSAHGTRKLDFPYIKTLSVPKLKIDQICRLKQRLQGIQQLKNCLVRKLALLQELQRSLSARAFTGQL